MSVSGPELNVSGRDRASNFASGVPNSAVWEIALTNGRTRVCSSQGWTILMALRTRLVNLGATTNEIDASGKGLGKRTLARMKARAEFWVPNAQSGPVNGVPYAQTELGQAAARLSESLGKAVAAANADEFVQNATDAQLRALTAEQRDALDRQVDGLTDEERLRITLFAVYLAFYDFDATTGTPLTPARRNEGIGFYPAWFKMSLPPDTLPLPIAQSVAPAAAEAGSSEEPSCVSYEGDTVNPATNGGGGASVRRAEPRDSVWYAVGGLVGAGFGWGLAKLLRR